MTGINFQAPFTKTIHKTAYDAINPTQPSLSAAGKTVLITAGHTGIGFSIAQNFAAAGASHVILLARRLEVLEKSAKNLSSRFDTTKFHYFAASLTDHVKVKEVFEHVRADISSDIHVLVSSAAYAAPPGSALDHPLEEISASLDTNFLGNVNLVKEFLAGSPESSMDGKVILDISTAASHLLVPGIGVYGVSKLAFTQWLANVQQDMAGKGLRVHSFHPGAVYTEAAKAHGLKADYIPWDDVQLPGQFAIWLASKKAIFLKGRFVWAKWDVGEMMERKGEFERDPDLLRIGLMGNPASEE